MGDYFHLQQKYMQLCVMAWLQSIYGTPSQPFVLTVALLLYQDCGWATVLSTTTVRGGSTTVWGVK